jgi:hypothetical protein
LISTAIALVLSEADTEINIYIQEVSFQGGREGKMTELGFDLVSVKTSIPVEL